MIAHGLSWKMENKAVIRIFYTNLECHLSKRDDPTSVALEIGKFFPFLDPKADTKIVQLDLLRVAVVYPSLTFHFKFISIISINHKAGIIYIYRPYRFF